jgi:hypothetical protein
MSTAVHLALKETWRNRGRFLLFSMVVALITLLILFIAALGEGLGSGNREYLESRPGGAVVLIAAAALWRPKAARRDRPRPDQPTLRDVGRRTDGQPGHRTGFQVVEAMANLVHEQGKAGIMVTHDLRLVELIDRVIQMLDGRIERIISSDADLSCLADPATCRMIPTDALGYEEAVS